MFVTIPTFSHIEVYLTMFGWSMYELLFTLADDLNLLLLPFLVILVQNFLTPVGAGSGNSDRSVSMMRLDFPIAVVVFIFLVVPYVRVEPTSIEYRPVCHAQGEVHTFGDTDTTYDTTLLSRFHESPPRIPIFWAVVLAVSGGITKATLEHLPCFEDYSGVAFRMRSNFVEDPGVRRQFDHFVSQCFVPAWRKYEKFQPSEEAVPRKQAEYIGNRYFLDQPGYYRLCGAATAEGSCSYRPFPRPRTPVPEWEGSKQLPSCREWWLGNGQNQGLMESLLEYVPDTDWFLKHLKDSMPEQQIKEEIVRMTILNGPRRYGISSPDAGILAGIAGLAAGSGIASGLATWAASASFTGFLASTAIGATAYIGSEALGLYARLHILRRIAPMAQSLILMVLYMLLGAYMFLTLYSLGAAIRILAMIVAVRLFSLMFGISAFLDDALIDAMYPGMTLADAGRWDIDRIALGYLTMALHLLLPLGLLWVVYSTGGYAMRGLDALGPSSDPTGIGMAGRFSTAGMTRNIGRR